jgi:hypothetical protein
MEKRYYHVRGLTTTARERKERWPLLTVETKANGVSKNTNEMGPSLVHGWFFGLFVPIQGIFVLHWVL